jgi:dienelactone hydrolase
VGVEFPEQGDHVKTSSEVENVQPVKIPAEDGIVLEGELTIPQNTEGVVLFAHGSGSSRHSPRNRFVARAIQDAGAATLLFDLLTKEEEMEDSLDGHLRFDIALLARRLIAATEWVSHEAATAHFGIGYFGASTGGAAALVAAAEATSSVQAVVSRGGRPDLAGPALPRVRAPTLLIVGERDELVVELNEEAFAQLQCPKELAIVPRATHLFEERGALDRVAELAADWFHRHLKSH